MKNYKIVDNKLIIEIPLKTKRSNPYNESVGEEMDAIIGLYEGEYNNGICGRIDMDYKDKPDQWTDYIFKLNGTEEEFQEMCKELNIDIVYDVPSQLTKSE